MKKILVTGMIAALSMISSASASAAVVDINEFRSGWYDSLFGLNHEQQNTTVGRGGSNRFFNNYFAFDLSALDGLPGTIRNARITFRNIEGRYMSQDPTETFQLNAFEGGIDDLLSDNFPGGPTPYDKDGGIAIYSDLGDGAIYGSRVVQKPDPFVWPNGVEVHLMEEFTMTLSRSAIDDLRTSATITAMYYVLWA